MNISVGNGYAEEGIHFTYVLISDELKDGNQAIVIKAIDETEMNSKTKNRYNLAERIREAREAREEKLANSESAEEETHK